MSCVCTDGGRPQENCFRALDTRCPLGLQDLAIMFLDDDARHNMSQFLQDDKAPAHQLPDIMRLADAIAAMCPVCTGCKVSDMHGRCWFAALTRADLRQCQRPARCAYVRLAIEGLLCHDLHAQLD